MVFGFAKDSGAGIKEKSKQRVEEDVQRKEGQRRDAERKDINDPGTDEGHASLAVQLEPIPPVGRGFSAVVAVLDTGVPGTLQKEGSSKDGAPVNGFLRLDGKKRILSFAPSKPSKKWTRIGMLDILDVVGERETDGGQDKTSCRVVLKEGAGSFIFVSTGTVDDLPSSEVTIFVALILKDQLDPLHPMRRQTEVIAGKENLASMFAELLQPLGLAEVYGVAFNESGILFEDLGVVTREDLAELVGVTDRRHQIKIMAQIKRRFLDHPPCRCTSGTNRRASGIVQGGEAAEAVAKVVGALVL